MTLAGPEGGASNEKQEDMAVGQLLRAPPFSLLLISALAGAAIIISVESALGSFVVSNPQRLVDVRQGLLRAGAERGNSHQRKEYVAVGRPVSPSTLLSDAEPAISMTSDPFLASPMISVPTDCQDFKMIRCDACRA